MPTTSFYTMPEDQLAIPFTTDVLGMEVTVERIDMTDDEKIVLSAHGGDLASGYGSLICPCRARH